MFGEYIRENQGNATILTNVGKSLFTGNANPFASLENLSNQMGNPIISFHLTNLLWRQNYIAYQSMKMYNNYEFWNYRSLR